MRSKDESCRKFEPPISPCLEGIGKMKEPSRMNREECLAIHELMLAQHGGLAGVRDEGLLESALSKPQNLFAYASPTLAEMAGGHAGGNNFQHPLFHGNKSTGI